MSACASSESGQQTNDMNNEQVVAEDSSQPQNQMQEVTVQNEQKNKDEAANSKSLTSESIPMSKIYDYSKLSKFTYEVTTTNSGRTVKTTFDYTLSSDNVNGRAAWLSTIEMDMQGAKVLSKVWSDKITYGCLKMTQLLILMVNRWRLLQSVLKKVRMLQQPLQKRQC
ncbi:MAG: hypothetical protein KatS3mg002_0768 [Candidatus Woesearchaeota archaeon]|nr:MAG: hypothetical protein KatS3mg002_0768 [Candidatus Woesearchaeota archaeon]